MSSKKKTPLTRDALCKSRLRELELSVGVVYFVAPSALQFRNMLKLRNSEPEEAFDETAKMITECIRDGQGDRLFETEEDTMGLPSDVYMELTQKFVEAVAKGAERSIPLDKISKGE